MKRHFTATTYIIDLRESKILFLWHNKLQTWLPPGGHLEINESPKEAALREIYEETGIIDLTFINRDLKINLDNRTKKLDLPMFLIEELIEENHFHLDFIYFGIINKNTKIDYSKSKLKWYNKNEILDLKNCFDNVKELAIFAFNQLI